MPRWTDKKNLAFRIYIQATHCCTTRSTLLVGWLASLTGAAHQAGKRPRKDWRLLDLFCGNFWLAFKYHLLNGYLILFNLFSPSHLYILFIVKLCCLSPVKELIIQRFSVTNNWGCVKWLKLVSHVKFLSCLFSQLCQSSNSSRETIILVLIGLELDTFSSPPLSLHSVKQHNPISLC